MTMNCQTDRRGQLPARDDPLRNGVSYASGEASGDAAGAVAPGV